MEKDKFSVIERGNVLEDMSLSLILGGAMDNRPIDTHCDYCNSCNHGGNNSSFSRSAERTVMVG